MRYLRGFTCVFAVIGLQAKQFAILTVVSIVATVAAAQQPGTGSPVPLAGTSSSLVVSQVYGGGGNSGATYKNDFVEVFNLSSSTVSLSGWSVQYASSTGSSWQVTALSGSIAPGQYYLVREAAGAGGTTDLPTPDALGGIAMSASSGKIALVNSTSALSGTCPTSASIVDLVGYGSANCVEGGGGAPTLSNTTAALRNNNGCTDSGSNNADFTAGSANPRNTSSGISPCSGGGGPSITTGSPLPTATNGVAYEITFGASGGSGTGYTFTLLSGTLPPGLTLAGDELSGVPTTTIGSPFSFTLQVTDSNSAASSKVFQLSVVEPNTCEADGPPPQGCGVERWSVKTGSDPDAALVDLHSATPTTIAALRSFSYPSPSPPSNGRVAPAETTQWVIHGTLTKYKLESDSDYHLVVQDGSGITMVTEIPYPGQSPACVSTSSPFLPGMANARCEIDSSSLPQASTSFQTVNVPIRITGVGMFDFAHGQTGAAPNQIEIHPILDIAFLTTQTMATGVGAGITVHAGDVAITFASVANSGNTTSAPIEPSSSGTAPAGYTLVGPAYDISTTATTSGAKDVCVSVPFIRDVTAFGKLKLLDQESGVLVDRTSVRSANAKLICGSVPALAKTVVALASTPGSIGVSSGDNQSVYTNTAFAPLKVIVTDGSSNPLSGVSVTFSVVAGTGNAGATFASTAAVMTDMNGIATAATLTANGTAGSFTVTASPAGMPGLATLTLTNLPINPPTQLVATATSSTAISVSWTSSSGATSYEVERIEAGGTTTSIGTTSSTALTDTTAAPNTPYIYKVRVITPSVSLWSNGDLASTFTFTDTVLTGVRVKAVHFTELRTAINAVRVLAGLATFTFTDALSGSQVKALHLTELRSALDSARATLQLPSVSYTNAVTAKQSVISAADINDLRDGLK